MAAKKKEYLVRSEFPGGDGKPILATTPKKAAEEFLKIGYNFYTCDTIVVYEVSAKFTVEQNPVLIEE